MRKIVLALAAFALAACSEPYDPPRVFDESFSDATGASSEVPSQGFSGLDDLAQLPAPNGGATLPARVLWTHGMCSPSDGTEPGDPYVWWQVRTRDLLAAYPGAVTVGEPVLDELSPHGAVLIKQKLRVPGRDGGSPRFIELWFFDWSPLTRPFKPRALGDIEAGKGNPYTYERAKMNDALKQGLVKDCFVDVVAYMGAAGAQIRNDAQIALCQMLDGQFDPATGCAGASGARYTALISESLGSTILFDAFRSLRLDYVAERQQAIDHVLANAPKASVPRAPGASAPRRKPLRATPSLSEYQASLATAHTAMGQAQTNSRGVSMAMTSLTSFYMLANQIPLLIFSGSHPLEEFMTSAAEMRKPGAGAAAMTVVAFVDPNDLLSFRLVPKSDRARVINFVVSNTNTYLGYLEMPTYAHCNYIRNGYVMHAIVFGYRGGEAESGPVDDPEKCF